MTSDDEEWREIIGYDNYEVSNNGRIRNRKYGRMLKPSNKDGYKRINLYRNGTPQKHYVHRLVAEAFIPNPECSPVVDHVDGVRDNNRVDNLVWVTFSENQLNRPSYRDKDNIIIALRDRITELEDRLWEAECRERKASAENASLRGCLESMVSQRQDEECSTAEDQTRQTSQE